MELVRYFLANGVIDGIWLSNTSSLATAQIVEDDPTYGYVQSDPVSPVGAGARYFYVLNGVITAKTQLVITTTRDPVAPDGIDEAIVSVSPFVPCTLVVNGTAYPLTTEDPTLILSSEEPMTFVISVVPLPAYWSDPLTLYAGDPQIQVTETVRMTATVSVFGLPILSSHSDGVVASESTTVLLTHLLLTLEDALHVGEASSTTPHVAPSVLDTASTEDVSMSAATVRVHITQGVLGDDVRYVYVSALSGGYEDGGLIGSMALTDTATMAVGMTLSVLDTGAVTESVTIALPVHHASIDTIGIAEAVTVALPATVAVQDQAQVAEASSVNVPVQLLNEESLTGSDDPLVSVINTVAVDDAVGIDETILLSLGAVVLASDETSALSDEPLLVVPFLLVTLDETTALEEDETTTIVG